MNSNPSRLYIFSFVLIAALVCGTGYTAQEPAQTAPMPPQEAVEESVDEGGAKGGKIPMDTLRRWRQLTPEQKEKLRKRLEQWKNLEPAQKTQIKQRFHQYQQLPPELKKKVRQNWRKIRNLPPQRRQEIVEKYKRWQQLSPEKKQLIRERHKRFRELSPEQKQQLRERKEKWQSLPPQRKQELRQEFRQKREERRGGRFLKEPPAEARRPFEGDRMRPAAEPFYRKHGGR